MGDIKIPTIAGDVKVLTGKGFFGGAECEIELDEKQSGYRKPKKARKTCDKEEKAEKQTPESIMLAIAQKYGTFYRTDKGRSWVVYTDRDVIKASEIGSTKFRRFLVATYFKQEKLTIRDSLIKQVLETLESNAEAAPIVDIYTRVGKAEKKFYLDLCNDFGQAVEIDSEGWRVVSKPGCIFRRAATARALPVPVTGGTIEDLRELVNIGSKDLVLLLAYLLACMSPDISYPLLIITGEQGSAKSSLVKLIKLLVDPTEASIRALSLDEKDLVISAQTQHILAYDNITKLSTEMIDALCRLATGGGISTRALYTDVEEMVLSAKRPVILNGIRDFVSRPDLVDRSVMLKTLAITEENRKTEQDLAKIIEPARPKILGFLCDLVSRGLARIDDIKPDKLPRMADFAKWAIACLDDDVCTRGAFMQVYTENREIAVDSMADDDTLVGLVKALMNQNAIPRSSKSPPSLVYMKSKTNFFSDIKLQAGNQSRVYKFLQSSRALSGAMKEAIPLFRAIGLDVDLDYRTATGRMTRIEIMQSSPIEPGLPPQPEVAPF